MITCILWWIGPVIYTPTTKAEMEQAWVLLNEPPKMRRFYREDYSRRLFA